MNKLSEAAKWFLEQELGGKIAIGCGSLFLLCCLCSGLAAIVAPDQPATPVATATVSQSADSIELATWTPTLTSVLTKTLAVTETLTSTPTSTETAIVLPTTTPVPASSPRSIVIISVNKSAEYVDIKNISDTVVNLNGWVLDSERGHQSCSLDGTIQPGEVLRVWAANGTPGYSCGYSANIWNNSELDPAVLYNPQGQEVSRYP